jgi:hypothetical protein
VKNLEETAADGISQLMKNNPRFVVENLTDFMQLYESRSYDDAIVEGMVLATNILDYNQQTAELIQKICSPFASKLVEILREAQQSQNLHGGQLEKKREEDFFENLTKMSLVIRNLEPIGDEATDHVMLHIFREFWPCLEYMLQTYSKKDRYMEKVCKIVKHTMRCIKHLFLEFLQQYFTIILVNYNEYPLPAYLYTVEIALTIFYKNHELLKWLSNMFNAMVRRTAQELSTLQQYENNPDLVEDYYGFMFRYIRYALEIFLECDCVDIILDNIIIGIGTTQSEAGKMLYNFILELFRNSKPKGPKGATPENVQILYNKAEPLRNILVTKYAPLYVKRMLESIPKDYPVRAICDEMQECWFGILRNYPQESVLWFQQGLVIYFWLKNLG